MKPEDFLERISLFQSLKHDDRACLAAALKRRSLKKGEALFRKGDEGTSLYIVKSGSVKVVLPSEMGDEVAAAILAEGDFFGEMALLDGMPRSADVVALEPSELLALNQKDFLAFLTGNEGAILAIFSYLSLRLRRTDELLEDAHFLNIPTRFARRLVELARKHGRRKTEEGPIEIDLHLTQKDLASIVGTTRESINKELRTLREKGLVNTEGNTLQIIDLERLEKRARLHAPAM
ncbi:MAG: Crp/Fnr family transcriptional regulator [Deltaproteobacteria bacterium]|nr:Crp/Fnr family transcriptional regulator [Deltaproteobacteria bacterium]